MRRISWRFSAAFGKVSARTPEILNLRASPRVSLHLEKPPLALRQSTRFKAKPRSGHQIPNGARDQHLARAGLASNFARYFYRYSAQARGADTIAFAGVQAQTAFEAKLLSEGGD